VKGNEKVYTKNDDYKFGGWRAICITAMVGGVGRNRQDGWSQIIVLGSGKKDTRNHHG
jgi:hypothetical protein